MGIESVGGGLRIRVGEIARFSQNLEKVNRMNKITISDLHARQAWPLEQKIDHTVGAIEAFINYCEKHGRKPYVSFSGGLNSTVLLDIARRFVDPDMPGVFCSTGNEWPEIVSPCG